MSDASPPPTSPDPADEELLERLAGRIAELNAQDNPDPADSHYLRGRLRALQESYCEDSRFAPGDLVRWRRGLKNKKRPGGDTVAIVIEHLSEPLRDATQETGSTYFNEPLDLRLGLIDNDGDFLMYMFDSGRFELVEDQTTNGNTDKQ